MFGIKATRRDPVDALQLRQRERELLRLADNYRRLRGRLGATHPETITVVDYQLVRNAMLTTLEGAEENARLMADFMRTLEEVLHERGY